MASGNIFCGRRIRKEGNQERKKERKAERKREGRKGERKEGRKEKEEKKKIIPQTESKIKLHCCRVT